jgi:hypothetical protein
MPLLRRNLFVALFTVLALALAPATGIADQGSGGGGSSGDSGNSGSGGGNDDDNSDDNDDGGDRDDDNDKIDHDGARDAVEAGKAMPLRKAMKRAKDQTDGRIIDVDLIRKNSRFIYVFTVVEQSGRIETLKMDAISGKFAGLFGF